MKQSFRPLSLLLALFLFFLFSVPERSYAQSWDGPSPMPTGREGPAGGVINNKLYVVGGADPNSSFLGLDTLEVYDPATNTWTTKAPMPTPRQQAVAGVINNKLYVVGGFTSGSFVGTLEVYDPATDTWDTKAPMPTPRIRMAAVVVNNLLYVVGGNGSSGAQNKLEVYDPVADSWTTKTNMPSARFGPAAGAIGNFIYVAGGRNSSTNTTFTKLEVYDTVNNTWDTTKASMSTARYDPGGEVIGGKFYVVGGAIVSGGTFTGLLEVYDPVANTWTTKAAMPTPRYLFATGVLNNQLCVVGGDNISVQSRLSVLEIYNPTSDKWTPIPSISIARQGIAMASVAGKLYVAGGMTSCCTPFGNLEAYDPATNSWSNKAGMPTPRWSLAAGVIGTKIYFVGGADSFGAVGTLEVYDTTNNTWASGASMPTPRNFLAVGVIGTKLYAVGGQDANLQAVNTLEIYDSTNNTWSTGTPMPTTRSTLAAAAIGTKLYVVGGYVDGVGVTNVLEIYDSTNNTWSLGPVILNPRYGLAAAAVNNQLYVVGGNDFDKYFNEFDVYNPASNTWLQKPPMPTERYLLGAAAIGQTLYAVGGYNGLPSAKVEALASPPKIQKSFGVSSIQPNGITSLTFNLQNPNFYVALSGVAFTDSLPSGLTVAPTPNLTNTCGGTATAAANSSSITLSGATLATNASCTVSVDVKAVTGGLKNNTVTATSNTTGADTSTGNASITVIAPPTIQKAFSVASIPLNGTTTLTFTIANPNTSTNLTGVAFSDTLPSSTGTLLVANTPNVINTCGGTVSATAGTNLISLSGGSVAQNSSCTLKVDVKGTAAGNADNTTGAITSTQAGAGTNSNTATLKVVAPPTIQKAFGATSLAPNGTTTLTFTIGNPAANTTAENGIAFSDTLQSGLQVASSPNVNNTCGGTVTAVGGTGSISLSGGSITTPGTTCTVVVSVTATQAGNVSNTTGAVSSTNGGTGATSNTANLTVCSGSVTVVNTNNSGAGTLRQALIDVCDGGTIDFNIAGAGPHTIALTSGELQITKNLSITGPTAKSIIISGSNASRTFNVNSGKTVSVSNLNLTDGNAASGAAIQNSGTLTLTGMAIYGNASTGSGGAIRNDGTLTIYNSTLSGNNAALDGGAILSAVGSATTLLNVTITNNHADSDNNNSGSGGGINNGGTLNIKNSIVAGNTAFDTANVFQNPSFGIFNDQGNNLLSGDPKLAALAFNGGATKTHALLIGSPALDGGDNTASDAVPLVTDQRGAGFARKLDSADAGTSQTVDIGAYEADPTVEDITDKTTDEDTPITVAFNVGDSATAFSSITATSSDTTLVPNLPANINITGSGGSCNLNISPAANRSGTSTITVTVNKTVGGTPLSMSDTFLLTVSEVNDPPSFTLPGNPPASDEDAGAQTVNAYATSISEGPNETGQTPLTFNVSVTGTTGSLAFTTAPAIDATTGNLTYTASPNTFGTASISVTLSDTGSNVLPNSNTSAPQLFTITVNPINDPPSFSIAGDPPTVNESAGPQTVNAYATSISEGPNETGQTPLTFNVSVTGTTGTLSFSTPPAIDATTGNLTYTATNGTNGTATFDVTLSDSGSNTPPDSNTSAAQQFTITVNAVNDPPVNTVPAAITIPQDTVLTFTGVNLISVADVDAVESPSDGVINVSLSATNGIAKLSGTAGLTFIGGADNSATMSFDGTIPAINAALSGMTFTPTTGYTGAASLQIVSNDQGKTGTGGVQTDTDTVNITVTAPTVMYINEVSFNPDASGQNEYIELRGTPNSVIPAGAYFVAVDGDNGNLGDVTTYISLSGLTFGSNGFLVLLQNGNTYTTAAGASVVTSSGPNPADAGFGGLPGAIFQADGGATSLENDSVTFMLIETGVSPTLTDDIDSDNDGTPDGSVYAGWSIRDSIGNVDGTSAGDHGYGAINYSTTGSGSSTGTVVPVTFVLTYVGRRGDTTGSAAADWAASGALGGAAPNFTLDSSPTEVEPSSFINKTLDHIGSTNFLNKPPVNTVSGAQATDEDIALTFNAGNANLIFIADTDANGASVKVTLTATNGTMSLSGTGGLTFTPAGAGNDGTDDVQMSFTGTLTDINAALDGLSFNPTPAYNGPASVAITTDDLGNTGVDGNKTASSTVNITINPINDPPSFVIPGTAPDVNEDAGPQTVSGFASGISQGPGDPIQTLTFNVSVAGTTGNIAFSSGPAIDATTGNLTYTTSPDTNGQATFDVTLSDNGSNVSPNSNTSGVQQFAVTVNAVNDAPTFQVPSNPPTVNEDAPSQTVAGFATSFQPGPATATDETVTSPQTLVGYTVTQTSTTGNLAFTSGPSIDNAGTLTYTPTGDTSGTATFNVVATDSGSGTSPNVNRSAPVAFTVTVTGQNDAPVIDNTGNISLNAIDEDVPDASNPGTLISDIIASAGGDRITDVDAGAVEGLAVTDVDNTAGTWQFSTDNGTNWTPFGTPNSLNARLLASDALTRVRFIPNLNFNGTIDPGLTFRAWDQSSGTNGNTADTSITGGITAFSTATETASLTVNSVNDAPVANNDTLPNVAEDSGAAAIPFSALLGNDSTGPADESGQTLTVRTVGTSVGGTVSILGGAVQFTPTANYNGPASFQYTVEDNGTPALQSAVAATASFNVTPVADTPSVTNASTLEDTQTTSGLVISRNPADGLEVTHFRITAIAGGSLFLNDGTTGISSGEFISFAQGSAGLKFTPDLSSTVNGSFQVQASLNATLAGLGGGLATATITVSPVNDPPTLDPLSDRIILEDAGAQTVNLSGITAGAESQFITITATSNNTGLIPNPTISSYASPNATGTISFTPVANQSGVAIISVTATDNGGTANGGTDSVTRTFTVTVNAVNDAPVNTVPGAQSTNRNTPLTFTAANPISASDVDAGGANVQATLAATNGTVTLSSTAGLVFTTGDGTADATLTFTGTIASINAVLSGLVFTPTTDYRGAASLQITTNDLGNSGAGGPLSDTDTVNITVLERMFQFSLPEFSVGEEEGHATVTVTRLGDTAQPGSVDYATGDLSGLTNCNVNTGDASPRCDFTAVGGTLSFVAGQSSATFEIPITNDVYVEGTERLPVTLSSPQGGILGMPSTATVAITDNDLAPGAPNPIDERAFFVRQLYMDVLNREPEPAGLAGWLNRLNTCPRAGETLQNCDEIEVASAFFRSPEFFDRAYFIYKFYEAALNRQPQHDEYLRNLRRMTGFLTAAELEQRKREFAEEFVNRPEFHNLYDSFGSGQPFVDAVLARAGAARPGVEAAIVTTSNRQSVAERMSASQITRGQGLRELMEAPEISRRFFNKAFVVVGYFAFLRRNPDAAYLHWIDVLNTTGDYREMIRGFIQAAEYRLRFGPM